MFRQIGPFDITVTKECLAVLFWPVGEKWREFRLVRRGIKPILSVTDGIADQELTTWVLAPLGR